MSARWPNSAGEDPPSPALTAQTEALEGLATRVRGACATRSEWPEKIAAGVAAVIESVRSAPEQVRLLVLDDVAADRELAAGVLAAHDAFAAMLCAARAEWPAAAALPELTERILVGAAAAVIGEALSAAEPRDLAILERELIAFLLMPYLGPEPTGAPALAG
jgi:hypothetical protein